MRQTLPQDLRSEPRRVAERNGETGGGVSRYIYYFILSTHITRRVLSFPLYSLLTAGLPGEI